MALVTGVLGSVVSKLGELLKEEYQLQTGVRDKIMALSRDLESMNTAVCKVAEVPPDQLDDQVKLWAGDVREMSYKVEDIIDNFRVRVDGQDAADPNRFKRAAKKIGKMFSNMKARHQIADMIKTINKQAEEVATRRSRYKVDDMVVKPTPSFTVDPRLAAMHKEVRKLIGIDKSRGELISMLSSSRGSLECSNKKTMNIVSVFGFGGLGKTTLAKAVFDELRPQFHCSAFVSVGRNPDLKKVFGEILIRLDKKKYMDHPIVTTTLDPIPNLLIDELREFLGSKRYFIVVDDVWETESWEAIKIALTENDNGSIIVTTTRKLDVAMKAGEVYKLQPLSYADSKNLFHTRVFGGEDICLDNQLHDISDEILKKCDGVPLAIITMASLLAGKSREEWLEVRKSMGFHTNKGKKEVDDTEWILSLSYYDLPSHLRTCLLYLSVFPEDHFIDKESLIWKWIGEGFVHEKEGLRLFEVGEESFNDLINRSMIQPAESDDKDDDGTIDGCRVHDMVLDLIRTKSVEQNFVTILDKDDSILSTSNNNVRRLAIQTTTFKHTRQEKPQVRSLIAFWCDFDDRVSLRSFKHLRVLDFEHQAGKEGLHHLGHLLQLRYLRLGIKNGDHDKPHHLPKEMGNLKFLLVLDVHGGAVLPSSVGLLTQLVCLKINDTVVPDGAIQKLTSLEVLSRLYGGNEANWQFVKELGSLSELRELTFDMDESMHSYLLQSLQSLRKIQHITLLIKHSDCGQSESKWDLTVTLPQLRRLTLEFGSLSCSRVLVRNLRQHLPKLSHLSLHAVDLDDQDLEILGGLPELRHLYLRIASTATVTSTAADGCFQKLRSCVLEISTVFLVANEDSSISFTICREKDAIMALVSKKRNDYRAAPTVMRNLERLHFSVWLGDITPNTGSFAKLGLDYLPSLKEVEVRLLRPPDVDPKEKEETILSLRHAIEAHPNQPTLRIEHDED